MPNVALQLPQVEDAETVALYKGRICVELSRPNTVLVEGFNSRTGEKKNYLLKVTQFGKLLLI